MSACRKCVTVTILMVKSVSKYKVFNVGMPEVCDCRHFDGENVKNYKVFNVGVPEVCNCRHSDREKCLKTVGLSMSERRKRVTAIMYMVKNAKIWKVFDVGAPEVCNCRHSDCENVKNWMALNAGVPDTCNCRHFDGDERWQLNGFQLRNAGNMWRSSFEWWKW